MNNLLILIRKWRKKGSANPSWLDKLSFQTLSDRLFSLYVDQKDSQNMAFLEVTLPDFGMPVLYEEQLFLGVRKRYTFPPYLVEGYQNFAEKIDKHPKTDMTGANLAILDNYLATR